MLRIGDSSNLSRPSPRFETLLQNKQTLQGETRLPLEISPRGFDLADHQRANLSALNAGFDRVPILPTFVFPVESEQVFLRAEIRVDPAIKEARFMFSFRRNGRLLQTQSEEHDAMKQ